MTVDIAEARCYGCGKFFPLWSNEWFCSDACRSAYPDEWPKVAGWIRMPPETVILDPDWPGHGDER